MTTRPATESRTPSADFWSIDLRVLSLVSVWGVNFVLIKSALVEMSALGFNALRFGLGTLLMPGLWFVSGAARKRSCPIVLSMLN